MTLYIYIEGGCTWIVRSQPTEAMGSWLWTWHILWFQGVLCAAFVPQNMFQMTNPLHIIDLYNGGLHRNIEVIPSEAMAGLLALDMAIAVRVLDLCCSAPVSHHMNCMTTSLHNTYIYTYIYMYRGSMHTNIHVIVLWSYGWGSLSLGMASAVFSGILGCYTYFPPLESHDYFSSQYIYIDIYKYMYRGWIHRKPFKSHPLNPWLGCWLWAWHLQWFHGSFGCCTCVSAHESHDHCSSHGIQIYTYI